MRSKLFVPASRPELFEKALASEADAVALDLEDAVAPDQKPQARANLAAFLQRRPASAKTIVVRVNAFGTEAFDADMAALVGLSVDVVNLPRAEEEGAVREAISRIAGCRSRAAPDRCCCSRRSQGKWARSPIHPTARPRRG